MFSGILAELERNLKKLPGVGNKTAQRLAMFMVSMEKKEALDIAAAIEDAVNTYRHCEVCNMLTDKEVCEFCSDTTRDDKQLCLVQNTQDVYLIEQTHEYKGKYFVLNNLLSPLDGIGPEGISFPALQRLVEHREVEELILALNPSAEGESTINFIGSRLAEKVHNVTRLSTGLPFGGDIEYTSSLTLSNALRRRYSVKE